MHLPIYLYRGVALATVSCVVLLATGCSQILKPPQDDARARLVIERLLQHNSTLNRYKGLAALQMRVNGIRQSARIAFAAVHPDKMRIELLNPMGTPLTSLSGDGETVTVISHTNQKQYRFRQTRKALAKLIEIPVSIEDLQLLLAGRVPVPRHASVQNAADLPNGVDGEILLKNRWNGIVARLHLDQTSQRIKSLRVLGSDGGLQYQIQWLKWREVRGYAVPSKLVIDSGADRMLTLTMDRFWPNATVAPSTFVLEFDDHQRS